MFFIYPIWDHESQRIGKKKCTSIGYAMHVIAELLGFAGLLLLLTMMVWLPYKYFTGYVETIRLWALLLPFILGLISELLYRFSWWLAKRKEFHYDYEKNEASWVEAGKRRSYKWSPDPIKSNFSDSTD